MHLIFHLIQMLGVIDVKCSINIIIDIFIVFKASYRLRKKLQYNISGKHRKSQAVSTRIKIRTAYSYAAKWNHITPIEKEHSFNDRCRAKPLGHLDPEEWGDLLSLFFASGLARKALPTFRATAMIDPGKALYPVSLRSNDYLLYQMRPQG